MPSFRRKLKATLQKWRAMAKRRIHRDDDDDVSAQGSKQQRTMTNTSPGAAQGPSTVSALGPPPFSFPTPFSAANTATAISLCTTATMGISQSCGADETSEDYYKERGSSVNPIDLTESPRPSGSSFDDPIDLTTTSVRNNPRAASLCPQQKPDDPLFVFADVMDTDKKTVQINRDRLMAQALQEEVYRLEGGLATPKHRRQSSARDDPLVEYRQQLRSMRCANCRAPIKIGVAELVERTKNMLKDSRLFHPCVACPACRKWTCVGGDKYYEGNSIPTLKHVASTKAFKSTWCCDHGRLFLIFSLLCGPESPTLSILQHQKSKPRAKSESSVATTQETRRQKLRQSQLSEGIGYGDRVHRREKKNLLPKSGGSDNSYDLELYFQGLASVWLPAINKSAGLGCFPRSVVPEMLARSPMLQHASELLRHAAIQEINSRRGPITALLDFLETVGHHAETCQLLLRPRILFPPTEQLGHAILGNGKGRRMTGAADHETAQSIATVVETLAISHRKFLETARKSGNLGARDDKALFEAAQRICAIADGVGSLRGQLVIRESQEMSSNPLAALFRSSTANVTTRRMRAAAARKAEDTAVKDRTTRISEWHRINCVKEVPDDTILKHFHYAQAAANAAKNSKTGVGRMKKLLAQISSLSTDLPEGIFVRHGESRIDVLKVMIVGPADTPYEHGLFEFDMFCDNDFPKKPPQMFFRTTGNGLVSFNPNLYQNGKVCLSLLGTWHGEPWQADKSTILQILVSIQAMVFNDKPYYNEPGFEYHGASSQVESYNRNVERLTVQHAILPWLTERLVSPAKREPTASAPDPPPVDLSDQITAEGAQSSASSAAGPSFSANTVNSHAHPASAPLDYDPYEDWMVPPPPGISHHSVASPAFSGFMALSQYLAPDVSQLVPSWARTAQGPQQPAKEDDLVWGDVIRTHFELKTDMILATLQKWERQAAGAGTQTSLTAAACKLKQLLGQHGFND